MTSPSPSPSTLYGIPRPVVFEVPRHRVDRVLDEEAPFTAVVADRGLGKTTAVAGWARRAALEGVWVALGEDQGRREAFWEHVFGLVEDATAATRAPINAPIIHGSDLRRAIVQWAQSVSRPFILVVDGVHDLESSAVADLLAVAELSTGLRIIAISRPGVTLPTDAPLLGADDLLFSEEETREALQGAAHHPQPAEIARAVHRETSGHPRLVSAVARDVARYSSGGAVPPGAISRLVGESVERLLIDGVASVDLAIIRRIALLGHASLAEANEIAAAPIESVRAALEAAVGAGLARWKSDGVVFPEAVARALTAPLRDDLAHVGALRLAASMRGNRGEVFEAVSLAIDARDFRAAVVLGSPALIELLSDHTEPLLAQLSAIPMSELSKHPLIVLFLAVLHAQRSRGRVAMLALLARADHLARAGGGTARPAERAVLLAARSVALRLLGQSEWAASTARRAVDSLDSASPEEAEGLGLLRSLVLGQASLALFWNGDLRGARDLATRTATIDGAPERARQHAWAKSAAIEAVWGDIVSARDHARAAAALDRWPDDFFRVPGDVSDALIAVETLDRSTAASLLDDLGRRVETTEFWPIAVVVRAYLLVADRRAADAVRLLNAALDDRAATLVSSRARHAVFEALAVAHLAEGDRSLARVALRKVDGGRRRTSVASVLLQLAVDEPEKAIALATEALRSPQASPRLEASFRLLRAAAALRRGHRIGAARDVSIALDILGSSGLRTPWSLIPGRDREGLDRIAAGVLGVDPSLVAELASMPLLLPDVPPRPPLTTRETEVVVAIAAGRSNAEIASFLGISINTVRKQRASAYRKLGVSTRDEALAVALERGILDPMPGGSEA